METIKILEEKKEVNFDYDGEADVLYLSFGEPQEALGIDIGEGTIIRYKEDTKEIVGVTILGIRERLIHSLSLT